MSTCPLRLAVGLELHQHALQAAVRADLDSTRGDLETTRQELDATSRDLSSARLEVERILTGASSGTSTASRPVSQSR